jgi:uncharacterized peroxidase-related enzyme
MWRLTPIDSEIPAPELPKSAGQYPRAVNEVSNFLRLLAKSPASATAFLQAQAALAKGQLTPPQREEIALAVAAINGSNYCLVTHEAAARQAGLGPEEIASARKASAKDPKTNALLHFVQAIVLQRGEVSDRDFSAIQKAGYSEGEIIEILANVVMNVFTNYFNLIAQTELDHWLPSPGSTLQRA